MTKPKLSIDDRVDLLLEHGTENPQKWATVHGYQEPEMDETWTALDYQHEWARLRQPLLEETKFLFEMLEAMKKKIDGLHNEIDNIHYSYQGEEF